MNVQNMLIRQLIKNKECNLGELYQLIANNPVKLSRWGSCQYTKSQEFFDLLQNLKYYGMAVDRIYRLCKIDGSLDTPRSLKAIKACIIAELGRERNLDPKFEARISNVGAVDELFRVCKESAWDLWGAAGCIFRATWPRVSIDKHPGDDTGLQCWLLVTHNIVRSESCFNDFDT